MQSIVIYFIIASLPLLIGAINWPRLNKPLRYSFFLIAFGLFIDIICRKLANEQQNNIAYINFYRLVEWSCIPIILMHAGERYMQKIKPLKYLVITIINWCIIIALRQHIETNYTQGVWESFVDGLSLFNTWICVVESFTIIFFAGRLFLHLSNSEPALASSPMFWVTLSYFLYFTMNLAVFGTAELKVATDSGDLQEFYSKSWAVHNFITEVSKIMMAIGFALAWRTPVGSNS